MITEAFALQPQEGSLDWPDNKWGPGHFASEKYRFKNQYQKILKSLLVRLFHMTVLGGRSIKYKGGVNLKGGTQQKGGLSYQGGCTTWVKPYIKPLQNSIQYLSFSIIVKSIIDIKNYTFN